MSDPKQIDPRPERNRDYFAHFRARTVLEQERARHRRTEKMLEAARVELQRVRARFESAFHIAPIGMALVDMQGRWIQANDALCRLVGRTREELEATTLAEVVRSEDVDLDERLLRDLLDGRIPSYEVEKRIRHASGHDLWALVTVSLARDRHGYPIHYVTQLQDISERKALAARQEYLVDHDPLTGLFNGRRFHQELAREEQRISRYGVRGAVLMIDLDNFKSVNDAFGHRAGDDLLADVAGALRHRTRQADVLARVGGDEFAVLLPETEANQARIVAEGVVENVSRLVATLGDAAIHVSASVGVATLDGFEAAGALECADVAMYEAKETGGNRVAMYRPNGRHADRVSRRAGVDPSGTALDAAPALRLAPPIAAPALSRASEGSSTGSARPAPSCRAAPRTARRPARGR